MNSAPLCIGILGTANMARAFVTGVSPAKGIKVNQNDSKLCKEHG